MRGWEDTVRLLFVHGTGVRRESHDVVFELIKKGFADVLPGVPVTPCFWGEEYGVSLDVGGRSIPATKAAPRLAAVEATEAIDPADQAVSEEIATWGLLVADPLYELRVIVLAEDGGDADESGSVVFGVQSTGLLVEEGLGGLLEESLGAGDELTSVLGAAGLAEHFVVAVRLVHSSEEFSEACTWAVGPSAGAQLATTTARALVAAMLAAAGDDALCSEEERDRAVDLLAARLGGTARFPGMRTVAFMSRAAMRVTTQPMLEHFRGSITSRTTPALGDILRYQGRGGPLREFLRHRIEAAEDGPVVVVGHSLGGIALVDLLALSADAGDALQSVPLLVTVGSQAPYLHRIGALVGLPPGGALPMGFPQWLNIYDRQDLLSYVAEPVFPGDLRVRDFEVRTGQPFPVSHSTYWKKPALYERIGAAIEALG